jgi:hypothetical protein
MSGTRLRGPQRQRQPRSRLWLGSLVAGLVVAGCGSGDDWPAVDHGDHDRGASGEARASTSRATAEPTTSTLPPAADGTDLAACADGNCEVAVSRPVDIPLTGQGGITTLSVDELTSDGFSFSATSNGGGSRSGSLSGACTATFSSTANGSGLSSMCTAGQEPPAASREPGVLSLQLLSATDDGVVVRLVSG